MVLIKNTADKLVFKKKKNLGHIWRANSCVPGVCISVFVPKFNRLKFRARGRHFSSFIYINELITSYVRGHGYNGPRVMNRKDRIKKRRRSTDTEYGFNIGTIHTIIRLH